MYHLGIPTTRGKNSLNICPKLCLSFIFCCGKNYQISFVESLERGVGGAYACSNIINLFYTV